MLYMVFKKNENEPYNHTVFSDEQSAYELCHNQNMNTESGDEFEVCPVQITKIPNESNPPHETIPHLRHSQVQ